MSHSPEAGDMSNTEEPLSSDMRTGTDRKYSKKKRETSQATPEASAYTATATATTAQAGAAADVDFDDETKEALTQDQPDDEEQPPGDDLPGKGRAAAGAEDSVSQHPHLERDDEQRQPQKKYRRKALLLDNDTQE
ncbi:uncharacterized protein LOC129179832 isoform X2 [Dunckerocampus dactyliophorus]|uniref:uncharacterized protein LOC129179832 isoform X2 n=1 Tax=Dunckerocampus dactyliophorus TaxID=161453 RepID=UPI0024070356|nr:uncharacterized protein LOC129179832 isoform X2 [Dunckerocampus dactyliophorus]